MAVQVVTWRSSTTRSLLRCWPSQWTRGSNLCTSWLACAPSAWASSRAGVQNTGELLCAEPGIRRGNEDSGGNENRKSWNKMFSVGDRIEKHTFFSMDLWMQIEDRKLIFSMRFIVLHFFKFASRMPSNCSDFCLDFQNFSRGACPRTPFVFL